MYFFGIVGLLMLGYGLYLRFSSKSKNFYLPGGSSVLTPTILRFVSIPLGITAITLALVANPNWHLQREVRLWLFICSVGPMILLSLLFAVVPPRFLLPDWLNWLHETYGVATAQDMLATVKILDEDEWEKRVSTQEGLEAWAEETYQQIKAEQEASGRR